MNYKLIVLGIVIILAIIIFNIVKKSKKPSVEIVAVPIIPLSTEDLQRSVSESECANKLTEISSQESSNIEYCGKVGDCQVSLDKTSCIPRIKEFKLRSALIVGVKDAWSPSCFTKEQQKAFKNLNWKECVDGILKQGICAFHFTIFDNNTSSVRDKKFQLINYEQMLDKSVFAKKSKKFIKEHKDNPYLSDVIPYLIDSAFKSTIRKGFSDNMLIIYLNVYNPMDNKEVVKKLSDLFNVNTINAFSNKKVILTSQQNILDVPLSQLNGSENPTVIIFINHPNNIVNLHHTIDNGITETSNSLSEFIIKESSTDTSQIFTTNVSKNDYSEVPLAENKCVGLYFGLMGETLTKDKKSSKSNEGLYLSTVYGTNKSFIVPNKNTTNVYSDKPLNTVKITNSLSINNPMLQSSTTFTAST